MGVDMELHCEALEALAGECERCTEFGVRAPDLTSSTMSLLRGTKKSLVSYDIVSCGVEAPQRLAKELGKLFMFIRASSMDVEIEPTELLMIDSLHTYEQLLKELVKHSERVEKFIVMHDTDLCGVKGEDGKEPGLQMAVFKFLVANPEWILHSHNPRGFGLTVIRRKCVYTSLV